MTSPNQPRRSGLSAPTLDSANPLERLAYLVNANDRLIGDLAKSRERIVAVLSYLDKPDCNVRIGSAHLERCRARHSRILAELRSNRIEALNLLDNPSKSND